VKIRGQPLPLLFNSSVKIRFQSAGTAILSFQNNPADELSSKAEQLIRQSVKIRVNPWAKIFLFNPQSWTAG